MVAIFNDTAVIDDVETPALPLKTTWFVNMDGEWECVELVSCEPAGWGWCEIKWMSNKGWQFKSVPIIQLHDLDSAMDADPKFAQYETALAKADAMED